MRNLAKHLYRANTHISRVNPRFCLGFSTLRGQAITAPTIDRLSFKRSVSSLRRLLSFSIYLNFSRTNFVRETVQFTDMYEIYDSIFKVTESFFSLLNAESLSDRDKNFLAFYPSAQTDENDVKTFCELKKNADNDNRTQTRIFIVYHLKLSVVAVQFID